MITRIQGKLVGTISNSCHLEADHLWYELALPTSVADRLPELGTNVTLHTYHYIEGAAMGTVSVPRLIGFLEPLEREFFAKFTSVPGLGLRTALQAMTLPVEQIAMAIEEGDEQWLKGLAKIGPKMAKKIVAELQGKMGKFAMLQTPTGKSAIPSTATQEMVDEAKYILTNQLSYSAAGAKKLIDVALQTPGIETSEDLLQQIFKNQKPK